jgi:hypothetical protein
LSQSWADAAWAIDAAMIARLTANKRWHDIRQLYPGLEMEVIGPRMKDRFHRKIIVTRGLGEIRTFPTACAEQYLARAG